MRIYRVELGRGCQRYTCLDVYVSLDAAMAAYPGAWKEETALSGRVGMWTTQDPAMRIIEHQVQGVPASRLADGAV